MTDKIDWLPNKIMWKLSVIWKQITVHQVIDNSKIYHYTVLCFYVTTQ